MLSHELFPEPLIDAALDILKETTPDEREIIRIVVEIVNELCDSLVDGDLEPQVCLRLLSPWCKIISR